jgi:hypothetical protein
VNRQDQDGEVDREEEEETQLLEDIQGWQDDLRIVSPAAPLTVFMYHRRSCGQALVLGLLGNPIILHIPRQERMCAARRDGHRPLSSSKVSPRLSSSETLLQRNTRGVAEIATCVQRQRQEDNRSHPVGTRFSFRRSEDLARQADVVSGLSTQLLSSRL